jgi:hypothetical protein
LVGPQRQLASARKHFANYRLHIRRWPMQFHAFQIPNCPAASDLISLGGAFELLLFSCAPSSLDFLHFLLDSTLISFASMFLLAPSAHAAVAYFLTHILSTLRKNSFASLLSYFCSPNIAN